MAQYTPAPWTIHEEPSRTFPDGEVDHGGYRIDAENIEQIAFVWRSNKRWGDHPTPFGSAEAEADARLIAAAPTLLEALKDLVRFLDNATTYEATHPQAFLSYHRASAAIAAAEGAQS